MLIKDLSELLKIFPEDWEVFIQTTPNDLCQPLAHKGVSILETFDARADRNVREQPKLLFTAYHPEGAK
jgi:hypothetical protein